MDIFLGFGISGFAFLLLLYAAVKDWQTREVNNWIWGIGLLSIPITAFRLGIAGLLVPYVIQACLIFALVILGFWIGILGGADGKALLLVSFLYPWIILDFIWLLTAPLWILIGGFLIVGIRAITVFITNLSRWLQFSDKTKVRPAKRMFWITRCFIYNPTETRNPQWQPEAVPLIVYFFLVYTMLLIFTGGRVIFL